MQGNSRDVGSQAADTFFLPVILLPGTLPVKISNIPHAESYFANGCLMGDLLIWICDTSGERVRMQGTSQPDTFRQQVLTSHLGTEHYPHAVVKAAVEPFYS